MIGTNRDTLLPGTMVGEFRVVALVGHGGMGAVYRATQPALGNAVAIKVLRADHVWDPAAVERFEQEARTVAALRHPGIVSVYSFGELVDGRRYYVMELLEGQTVKQRLAEQGRLGVEQTMRTVTEVASALDAAHAQGVIHRDVKPSNIFLQRGAGAKLLDFGVAKLLGARDSGITGTEQHPGTPQYMSPEQTMGRRLDRRSDIYSLALVAFEGLAGVSVFGSKTPGEIALLQQTAEVSPLSSFVPELGALDAPLQRAMQRQPELRPARASDFARMLCAAAGVDSPGADREGDQRQEPPGRLAADAFPSGTRSLGGPPPLRQRQRKTLLLAGIGVAVVAAVAAAIGAWIAGRPWPSSGDRAVSRDAASPSAEAGSTRLAGSRQADASPADAVDAAPTTGATRPGRDAGPDATARRIRREVRRPIKRRKKRPRPKVIDDLIRF